MLRYAEFTNRPRKEPWSLRQMAVYNRFKPTCVEASISTPPRSTWILVGASGRAEELLDLYSRHMTAPVSRFNPFELHAMMLDISIASWRAYLIDLGNSVSSQVCHPAFVGVCRGIIYISTFSHG